VRREAEELTEKLRDLVNSISETAGLPRLQTKRQQLRAITETIEHLRQENVPVPDNFYGLRNSLADEIDQGVNNQVVLYFLKKELLQIVASIENGDKSK
jgi:hypothetical protein